MTAKRTTLLKSLVAIVLTVAIGWSGFHFFPLSRDLSLFVYLLLFVLLAYFVAIFRARARDVALALASVVFGLGALELAAVALNTQNKTYSDKSAWGIKPELGWGLAQAGVMRQKRVAANGKTIFDVAYTIDDNLTRKVVSSDSGPTIAFFGDSFTFGDGVPDSDTLPQAFADATGHEFHVLNFGVSGYGPQQFLRALEIGAYDGLLKPDPRLFVMLTSPWQAHRSACKGGNARLGPRYELTNGTPVYRGPCSGGEHRFLGLVQEALRLTTAYQYFVESRQAPITRADIDLYVEILIKAGEIARQKYGVATLVLFLPDDLSNPRFYAGVGYSNEDIVRKLRDGGLQVVNAMIDPNAYPGQDLAIPGDGHPTGLANRVRAGRVKDFMASAGGEAAAQ